jgi:hypothetical protein
MCTLSGGPPVTTNAYDPAQSQLGVCAQVSPHEHGGQTEQTAHQPVQDRQQHPTMIHARAAHEERKSGHCI